MLMDLYIPTVDGDGAALPAEPIASAVGHLQLNVAVVVGNGALPPEDDPIVTAISNQGVEALRAMVLEAHNALLWVLPPDGVDPNSVRTESSELNEQIAQLSDAGCAVLLCNPYARALPGGNFRDYGVYLEGIHGILALLGSADFQENLLAQEFGIMRGLPCAGGARVAGDHADFGRFLTLGMFSDGALAGVLEGIRQGAFRSVETAQDKLVDMFPQSHSRPERRRDKDGGRDGGRGRGRDGGRGRRRDGGRGRDRNRKPRD